jgi:hypothetical protein
MDYLIAVVAIGAFVKLLLEALKNSSPQLQKTIQKRKNDKEYSEAAVIRKMYKYWKVKMYSAASTEEGAACLRQAGKSELAFKASIDKSLAVLSEEAQTKQAIEQADNVHSFKPQ